jgi:Rod binding domain-containing protein
VNNTKLILTEAVSPQIPLEKINTINSASEEKQRQFAKDFESVFINKLLDEMKNTIGDWGLEKDGTSKQIEDIFWLYLSRDIANNGGFGMWKDIYQFFTDSGHKSTAAGSLDENL